MIECLFSFLFCHCMRIDFLILCCRATTSYFGSYAQLSYPGLPGSASSYCVLQFRAVNSTHNILGECLYAAPAECGPLLHSSVATPSPQRQGFSLGHGFPLIPPKMVAKIEQFEFFNMAELLPDNIELSRKTEAVSTPSTCLPKVSRKRELQCLPA